MSRYVFVDRCGGALASLAASIASARGLAAQAHTTTPLVPREEVAVVLAEIGIDRRVEATVDSTAAAGDVVKLGEGGIDVALYEGPERTEFGDTKLERLALARISRDRLERWLEQRT